jgi:hypothetical protein
MRSVLEFIYLAAIAVWFGSLVFFSFFVVPTLFQALPPATAGDVVGAIFPLYSRLGVACGALAAVSAIALARKRQEEGVGGRRFVAVVLAFMLVLTIYAGEWIAPRAAELRAAMNAPGLAAADATGRREAFMAVHRRSVAVNGAVLLLAAGLLFASARDAARR